MFTLDQIGEIHHRFGKQSTLVPYLQALKAIGVERYDSFVSDGHSVYYGKNNHKLISPPVHPKYSIADASNLEAMLNHLDIHQKGKTGYLEMTRGLADSGVEKWTFDTIKMTLTYYSWGEREMLVEQIT
jgi:uncharacterized protein YbcV (DUF1398 family)